MDVQIQGRPGSLTQIDDRALLAHRSTWLPCLEGEDDQTWAWADFIRGIETEYGANKDQFLVHFALWQDQLLQGLMVISGPHICVAERNLGLTAVYIEYVAIAPWSRPDVRRRELCTQYERAVAIGSALFDRAVQESVGLEMDGRLAWHSVPRAEESYRAMFKRRCRSEPLDCGIDVGINCRLFETSAEMAREWLRNLGV